MNINPAGLTIKEWCDFMVSELDAFGQAPILDDEADWRTWGQQVLLLPGLAAFNPPNPRDFDDFFEWASRFNAAVPL